MVAVFSVLRFLLDGGIATGFWIECWMIKAEEGVVHLGWGERVASRFVASELKMPRLLPD